MPVIFSKDYALNQHWFLTFHFDLVNNHLCCLLIMGSLSFQTGALAVLCV